MKAVVDLILEIAGGELIGFATTELPYAFSYSSGISATEVNRMLGTNVSESDITKTFDALGFAYTRIDDPVAKAISIAKAQMGKPYEIGAHFSKTVPHTFDCSSLVAYAYLEAGIPIPRDSVDQYLWGEPISEPELKPGDLVFSNSKQGNIWLQSSTFIRGREVPEGVDHVGMYVGDGRVLHATRYGEGMVIEEPLSDSSRFGGTIVGCRRIVTDPSPRWRISVPFERLDIRLPQDIVEEVARIYGYERIEPKELPPSDAPIEISGEHYWLERIRGALSELGFTEIYTYSLRSKGDVPLANAYASDKAFLRRNLVDAMQAKLALNEYNAPLVGSYDGIRLFEIGQVFTEKGEHTHACFGVSGKGADAAGREVWEMLEKALGVELLGIRGGISEFDITELVQKEGDRYPELPLVVKDVVYQPPSPYPFVLRDIALWVSEGTSAEEVSGMIRAEGGELLRRIDQFDTFTKDGRTSHAFHLVFQSHEKTLSDNEAHAIMERMQKAIESRGWEVR